VNKEIMKKIFEAAVMAPSGDNVQPWDIRVSDNFTQIDLYNLPDKDNSYYNYQQSASYIAHGAVIENILISSRHLGCHAEYQLFPDAKNDAYIAKITLFTAEIQADPLYSAIFERHTNRFQYKRIEVTKAALKALTDSVKNIDTASVYLANQKGKIKLLAKELMVNDRIVFERKDIHAFLFDKIRWNKKQIEESKDGMPVGVLGLSFIEKLSFPMMRFWWYVKTANVFGLSKIIGLKCWWSCVNASILGMITIEGNDKIAFVEGGRAVQRLWLEATNQGLALQPIIGLTLLIHRFQQHALDGFSVKHEGFVKRAAKKLPELLGVKKSDTLIMGFRVGSFNKEITRTMRKSAFKLSKS